MGEQGHRTQVRTRSLNDEDMEGLDRVPRRPTRTLSSASVRLTMRSYMGIVVQKTRRSASVASLAGRRRKSAKPQGGAPPVPPDPRFQKLLFGRKKEVAVQWDSLPSPQAGVCKYTFKPGNPNDQELVEGDYVLIHARSAGWIKGKKIVLDDSDKPTLIKTLFPENHIDPVGEVVTAKDMRNLLDHIRLSRQHKPNGDTNLESDGDGEGAGEGEGEGGGGVEAKGKESKPPSPAQPALRPVPKSVSFQETCVLFGLSSDAFAPGMTVFDLMPSNLVDKVARKGDERQAQREANGEENDHEGGNEGGRALTRQWSLGEMKEVLEAVLEENRAQVVLGNDEDEEDGEEGGDNNDASKGDAAPSRPTHRRRRYSGRPDIIRSNTEPDEDPLEAVRKANTALLGVKQMDFALEDSDFIRTQKKELKRLRVMEHVALMVQHQNLS